MQTQSSNDIKLHKQRKWLESILVITVVALIMSGCATIFSGTEQDIQVKPNDAKIDIYTWDGKLFASPKINSDSKATVNRPKIQSLVVLMQKDGYCPRYWLTHPKNNNVILLNLVLGGIIGLLIDKSTGANSEFSPSEFQLNKQETQQCGS